MRIRVQGDMPVLWSNVHATTFSQKLGVTAAVSRRPGMKA